MQCEGLVVRLMFLFVVCFCYLVDSQQTMEETILVGDDLMMVPPSPLIPPEIASHVLEGVDLCDGILRNLFLCMSNFSSNIPFWFMWFIMLINQGFVF